jgi:glycosyltransferase involved in cell wall biosynthesis
MKGAYLVRLDLAEVHLLGVKKKIEAQISALSSFMQVDDFYYLFENQIKNSGTVVYSFKKSKFLKRLVYYFLFYPKVAKTFPQVDFLYIRYQGCSPLFLYMLHRLKNRNPNLLIFLELPSYPYHTEQRSLRGRLLGAIDNLTKRFMKYYVDRIVTFSKEDEIFGIPTIRTDNGVDVEQLKVSAIFDDKERINLVGVANLSFWHGYDRIIAGLSEYYNSGATKKIIFNIIGSGQELEALKSQVISSGLEDRVKFLGSMHGEQLDNIVQQSHIGISSIGMHRLDVDTSNLKSREFCARGLPFIIAYDDRDFAKELSFVFHAPANDDPIDIYALLEFYEILKISTPSFNSVMREYAEHNLTWHAKLKPVFDCIHKIQTH